MTSLATRAGRVTRAVGLVVIAGLFVLPVVLLLMASLHGPGSVPVAGDLWPQRPTLAAFASVFEQVPMARALLNSALVAAVFVPVAVASAAAAGFGIGLLPAGAQRWVIAGMVAAASIPYAAIWLPRFLLFQQLGLSGTWWPLWLPALMGGSPLIVLLYLVAMRGVARSQIEAGRLEGAGWLRVWWQVALPQVRPATVAAVLLSTAWCWANFIDPLLYLQSERWQTAPLMLHALELVGASNWSVLMAGAVIVTAPVVIVLWAVPGALDRTLGERHAD